ncbi:MAG: peptidylprolyl isomerase [Gammaproteobacteria bacterium]|nr:peptidylprolyl isomerase [Gammaproteobacteria bacterium]
MRMLKTMLCCGMLAVSFAPMCKPQALDGIAAVVNDAIITKSELAQQVRLIQDQLQHSGNPNVDTKALEKQVLEHLVMTQVQLQMAKKTGIQIDDIALDNAIENIAKQNHITVTQMRETVTAEGMDFNQYRNTIRNQIMISQLQQRDILPDIHVSEQEVNQFLNSPKGLGDMSTEYRFGHILVPLAESPSPEELDRATQQVQKIISQLRNGADFAQIALAESKDEQALKGGDLGWRKLPELPTLFEKIAGSLKVNDIPDAIKSTSGFHIIKLLDKRTVAQMNGTGKTLVRHILIKTNAGTSDNDAKHRLAQLRQKIEQGEDFEQLAKTHSGDLGSASNGGSLGWVSKDVLVPEFSEVMESLATQEISQPFKTPFGWHIMQVLERKTLSNDEVAMRQKAKEMIQQRKFEEKLQTWARQLRDESYVKTFDES